MNRILDGKFKKKKTYQPILKLNNYTFSNYPESKRERLQSVIECVVLYAVGLFQLI